jgi:hypothetical protein
MHTILRCAGVAHQARLEVFPEQEKDFLFTSKESQEYVNEAFQGHHQVRPVRAANGILMIKRMPEHESNCAVRRNNRIVGNLAKACRVPGNFKVNLTRILRCRFAIAARSDHRVPPVTFLRKMVHQQVQAIEQERLIGSKINRRAAGIGTDANNLVRQFL